MQWWGGMWVACEMKEGMSSHMLIPGKIFDDIRYRIYSWWDLLEYNIWEITESYEKMRTRASMWRWT